MITRIFSKRKELLQYLIVVAFSVLVFSMPITMAKPDGFNPLFNLLFELVYNNEVLIRILFILSVSIPIIFTQIIFEHLNIIERGNRYLLLVAPMLIFTNTHAWVLSPSLVSLNFLVMGTGLVFRMSENDKSIKTLSSAVIIFSIASLFYSLNIFSILVLIIGINIFRQVSVRDVVSVIFLFLLPYLYLFVYYFVTDQFLMKYKEFVGQFMGFGFNIDLQVDTLTFVFYIFITIVSLVVLTGVLSNFRSNLIQVRKYISFILWGVLNAILLFLFYKDDSIQQLTIVMFLISLLYVFFLNKKKKSWIYDIVFILILSYDLFLMYNQIAA